MRNVSVNAVVSLIPVIITSNCVTLTRIAILTYLLLYTIQSQNDNENMN